MKAADRLLGRLDALINFQEAHGWGVNQPLHINVSPTALANLIGMVPRKGAEFQYRGRTIVAVAPDPVAQRFRGGNL